MFKTNVFAGDLIDETHEGEVRWVGFNELMKMDLASGMEDYLKLYLDENANEAYAVWNDDFASEFKFF